MEKEREQMGEEINRMREEAREKERIIEEEK